MDNTAGLTQAQLGLINQVRNRLVADGVGGNIDLLLKRAWADQQTFEELVEACYDNLEDFQHPRWHDPGEPVIADGEQGIVEFPPWLAGMTLDAVHQLEPEELWRIRREWEAQNRDE